MKKSYWKLFVMSFSYFLCLHLYAENIVYPSNCYYHNHQGGNVICITQAPFSADSTGIIDCSDAIIAAYDTLVNRIRVSSSLINTRTIIIYFPKGTYKVSKTIEYSGDTLYRGSHENLVGLRFRGQCMDSTIIQLANNNSSFAADSNRPVISFGKMTMNNAVSSNFFENLTINTGSGNPGAIGLRFHGANNEAVRNVKIISEDSSGYIGLDMPMGACQGIYKNITIEGFDYGIHVSNSLAKSLSFEHIVIKNQNIAGFHLEESAVSIRDLSSDNSITAIKLSKPEGQMVLIESSLLNGSDTVPAIQIDTGFLFARNITTSGYIYAIQQNESMVEEGPDITEYVSDEIFYLFNQSNLNSLNLPIEETPEILWDDTLSHWACVNDFGAAGDGVTDDTDAIQDAMNSGKKIVYFLPGTYLIDNSVNIPASVEVINFMFSRIKTGETIKADTNTGVFRISGNSSIPLLIEDMFSWFDAEGVCVIFDHASTRTLVLEDLHSQRGKMYRNSVSGGKIFIENCSVRTTKESSYDHTGFEFIGQQAWIRYINAEYGIPEIKINRGKVWIFGFKTEGSGTSFEVVNGGEFELLGGICNGWGKRAEYPEMGRIINNKSTVSAVFLTGGPEVTEDRYYQIIVEETQNEQTEQLFWTEMPERYGEHRVIPLYIGYKQPVGMKENIVLHEINFYPNPFHNNLNLEVFLSQKTNISIRLFSITGQELESIIKNNTLNPGTYQFNLQTEHLANGNYLMRIETNEGVRGIVVAKK